MKPIILLALSALSLLAQSSALQIPLPRWQPLDNNGKIVPFGKICTYATGTFTPAATYTDNTALVQLANPVVLDSAGRADIWFSASQYYRIVFQRPGDNNCPGTGAAIWTQDGVPPSAIGNLIPANIVPVISPTAPGVLVPSVLSCNTAGCAVTGSGLFNVGTTIQMGFNPGGGSEQFKILNTNGNISLSEWTTGSASATIVASNGSPGVIPLILQPFSGNVEIAGNGLQLDLGTFYRCTHGANATCGMIALGSGTATVITNAIGPLATSGTAGWAIRLTYNTCSSCGTLSVGTVSTASFFTINSSNGADASRVFWEIAHIE